MIRNQPTANNSQQSLWDPWFVAEELSVFFVVHILCPADGFTRLRNEESKNKESKDLVKKDA